MLTPEQIDLAIQQHVDPVATYGRLHNFARAIEAEARRDALEEAAKWCESQWSNAAEKMFGVECAAAIRALKETTP